MRFLFRMFCASGLCLVAIASFVWGDDAIAGRSLGEWQSLLSRLDPRSDEAAALAPDLIQLVQTESVPWNTRRLGSLTLGRMGARGALAIPFFIRQLESPDVSPEGAVAWGSAALARYGTTAEQAGTALAQVVERPEIPVALRLGAMEAYARVSRWRSERALVMCRWALGQVRGTADEIQQLAEGATEALGLFESAGGPAVPTLVRLLDSDRERTRQAAALSLWQMKQTAELAAPALADRLVLDESEAVRHSSAEALLVSGPDGIEMARQVLMSDSETGRLELLEAIRKSPQVLKDLVAPLCALRDHRQPAISLSSCEALHKIDTTYDHSSARLVVELLADPSPQIRRRASQFLRNTGQLSAEVRARLAELSLSKQVEVRQAAQHTLRQIEREIMERPQ